MKCLCIACRVNTNHNILHDLTLSNSQFPIDAAKMQIIECAGCESKSFRMVYSSPLNGFKPDGTGFLEKEFLFPRRNMLRHPIDIYWLPEDIRNVYLEVLNALQNEIYILSAAGIRAIVEGICIHKKAPHKNLYMNITWLHEKGYVTAEQASAMHTQRFLGNEAVHQLSKPTEMEFNAALDIIEAILTSIYILPKRKALQESKARKRKNDDTHNQCLHTDVASPRR